VTLFDRDWYLDATAPEHVSLEDCPILEELPAQRRAVDLILDEAREAGLRIPSTLRISWRFGRDGTPPACVILDRGAGTLTLYLDGRLTPDQLQSHTQHEAQHVSDFASGAYLDFDQAELEMRADRCRRSLANGEDVDEDLLPPAPSTSTSTSTTRATASLKPKSLAPNPCEVRVHHLSDEIARRMRKLLTVLDGENRRKLRAVLGPIDELIRLATRKT